MDEDIVFRSGLKPGDLGAIVKLHGEYYNKANGFDGTFEPYVAIPLSEFVLRNQANENIWVIEKNNILKGCIAIVDSGKNVAQFRWYLLEESVQGYGLGRKLIEAALDFAKKNNYESIILWTVDIQDKAIGIYKKYGFELIEEKRHELWGKELNEQCYRLIIK